MDYSWIMLDPTIRGVNGCEGAKLMLEWAYYYVGQIIATSHDQKPQKIAEEGNSPYFREI